jgi:hypothetical protein
MKPQRPQGLSDGQWRALRKALSYSRVTRFSSVEEFMGALQATGDDTVTLDASGTFETQDSPGKGRLAVLTVLFFGLLGGVLYQYGLLDPLLDEIRTKIEDTKSSVQPDPVVSPPEPAPEVELEETTSEPLLDETMEPESLPIASEPEPEPLIDFSTLPPADLEVPFTMGVVSQTNFRVKLREDGDPVVVDFVRSGGLGLPLALKLDEIGFSGNRSPWAARQYAFSNDGIVRFPIGQERSRIVFTMASDPLREADQMSTLRLRELDSAASELAVLYITLEDDDQRVFEAQLPANTVAFAASQTSIRETAPAVQIDIVRFNPDDSRARIKYTVSDVTATEGEDYFAPGDGSITFGPGQRSARLLIPLVQDSLIEGDEAFVIQLEVPPGLSAKDVYQRIVVMIRDDEPQTP